MKGFLLLLSVSVLFISACVRVGLQYRSPDTGLSPPPAYQHVPPEAYPVPEDWWWEVFGDPEIDRLVQDVLKENWDVKQAAARVLEMTSFVGLQMGGGFHRGKIQVGEHLAQVIVQLVEGEKRPGISARRLAALPKEEVRIRLKPKARDLGLSMSDVAYQVRHAFYGAEALTLQRDRDEVKVMVRYPVSERRSLGRLEEMWIRTPSGHEVPLREVAELEMAQEYLSIERVDRRRVITVFADVDEAVANADRIRKDFQKGVLPLLEEEFPGLSYSIEGAGKE